MKKILFSLMALVCSMSMNAQVMKVIKNGSVIATFKASEMDGVVFEETPTSGIAKATINGNEVNVNWVQLWKNGPEFAVYNVGATNVTDKGSVMTFAEATKAGDDYVWGENWCTPSKDDMNELMKAMQGNNDAKVSCEFTQQNNVSGFKFTGKEAGHTSNSVFFPAQGGDITQGETVYATYWSGTAGSGRGYGMLVRWDNINNWDCLWLEYNQTQSFVVRPVLRH